VTLIAYVHETRSKALHLRVEQETFSEHVKAALERVGTPAVWKPAINAWDFLLSPAAVSALADRAKELGETVEWKEGLKEYAEYYIKQAETEHTVRLGIERVIKEKLPLDPYVCVADPPALRHQAVTFHWSQRVQGLLLAHDPGCIAGGTKIKILRHGRARDIALRNLYLKFNGLPYLYHWEKKGDTTVKSIFPDGTIRYNLVKGVVHRGMKPVVRVDLSSGKHLVCTPDHEVKTKESWARADALKPGDVVLTSGSDDGLITMPREDSVVHVAPCGEKDVYDLVMADPARNFAANGVIVHNCGKTRSAADAAGGWLRNGLIRPMTPRVNPDGSYGVEGGVLIACPKTMLRTWQEELLKWQSAQSVAIRGTAVRKRRLASTPSHFHIVNYEGLKYVMDNSYDAVIFDEAHALSNHSQRTENAIIIAQRTRKRLGLTGTPITNSLQSIFYPMLILDGGRSLGASRTAFLEKYFTAQRRGQFIEHEAKSDAAVRIAQAIAENTYFIKKEEVLDLPAKTHTPIYLEMNEEQQRYYKEIRDQMVTYIQDASVTTEQAAAKMQKLMQICQGFALTDDGKGRHFTDVKTEALLDMLTDQYANRKVVVWAPYQYEIQRLARALHERSINHIRIDGTVTSQTVRDEAMDRWNLDPAIKVYIRQSSMSEGVTLHAKDCSIPCCDCVYLGMTYRYVDWKQSQDRIHRIGQNYPCSYLYLLTENGIDRSVYRSVLDKEKDAAAVHKEGKDYYLRLLLEKDST
jgi:hypothetical protein